MKDIKSIVAIVLFAGACMSAAWFVDERYALAKDINALQQSVLLMNKRLDIYIVQDRLYGVNKEIEKIEDTFGTCDPLKLPEGHRARYRNLLNQRKELEQRLNNK